MILQSNKPKFLAIFLICANIIFSIFALYGIFEGKDLLPIIIGAIGIIGFVISLFFNRTKNFKLLWLFLLVLSGIGLYVSHFEIFLAQRASASRENSIQVLENNPAPHITYEQSLNFDKPIGIENLYRKIDLL